MAFKCVICGKKTKSGHRVSHSNRKSNRKFKPNLQKIRIVLDGKTRTAYNYVCTKCIKSNLVTKAI
ncbi:MAG: 50S ribosomal protein L28 [Elusimicrobia bacterium CG06_land_8_20_14_3_00_38_11]|nr:MAG: 50S ribosomal protein L28 [Elusimicrobia bacterium CG06_land_8_20_14_3_00_38_11]